MKRINETVGYEFGKGEMMEIGSRIAAVREKAGLKQQDMAAVLGLDSRKSVSKLETGESVCKVQHLYKICREFSVSADYLLFGEEEHDACREIMEICGGLSLEELKKAKRVLEAVFDK